MGTSGLWLTSDAELRWHIWNIIYLKSCRHPPNPSVWLWTGLSCDHLSRSAALKLDVVWDGKDLGAFLGAFLLTRPLMRRHTHQDERRNPSASKPACKENCLHSTKLQICLSFSFPGQQTGGILSARIVMQCFYFILLEVKMYLKGTIRNTDFFLF